MLTGQQLVTALAGLTTLSAQGVVFRCIHIKYQNSALSSIGSLKSGGRYNVGDKYNVGQAFAALYTSDSPLTARYF